MELRQIVYRLANNTHTRLVTHISHYYTQICNMTVVWISSYSDREIRSLGQMMVDILFVCPPQQWPSGCQALEWILKVNVPALNMCMCMHNCANSSKLTSYVVYILLKMYQWARVGVENRVKYWDNCPKCKVLVENFVFYVEMMTHLHWIYCPGSDLWTYWKYCSSWLQWQSFIQTLIIPSFTETPLTQWCIQ